MWRNVGAVILGYVVMFAVAFAAFSIAFLIVGTNGAFEAGSYDVTVLWLIISFVLGLIVAVAGGYTCATVAKGSKAPPCWNRPRTSGCMPNGWASTTRWGGPRR